MPRVKIESNIHKKVKAYAALNDLSIPEAYKKLLELALKELRGAEKL